MAVLLRLMRRDAADSSASATRSWTGPVSNTSELESELELHLPPWQRPTIAGKLQRDDVVGRVALRGAAAAGAQRHGKLLLEGLVLLLQEAQLQAGGRTLEHAQPPVQLQGSSATGFGPLRQPACPAALVHRPAR